MDVFVLSVVGDVPLVCHEALLCIVPVDLVRSISYVCRVIGVEMVISPYVFVLQDDGIVQRSC